MTRRVLPNLVGVPTARPIRPLLACVVAVVLPACGVEGAGSIHADPAFRSSVMITPDRKAQRPPQLKARGGRKAKARGSRKAKAGISRATPKASLPR
jgi:hypothetical protein